MYSLVCIRTFCACLTPSLPRRSSGYPSLDGITIDVHLEFESNRGDLPQFFAVEVSSVDVSIEVNLTSIRK